MNDKLPAVKIPEALSGGELQSSAAVGAVMQEIQGAMILAKHFPRDYMSCWSKLEQACERQSLAKEAVYSYRRGGRQIEGPSINLARVAAQCYGNIRTGMDIVRCDDELVHIRAWAWDIENNAKASIDDVFAPLIQRKNDNGESVWIKPDERDLRELINRRGAIAKRNAIFEMLPRDFIDDAVGICKQTMIKGLKDPKSEAKFLIRDFGRISISVAMLRKYLGHDEEWDANDLFTLRGVYTSINDGNSTRQEYFGEASSTKDANGKTPTENLADDLSSKAGTKKSKPKSSKKKTPAKKKKKEKKPPKGNSSTPPEPHNVKPTKPPEEPQKPVVDHYDAQDFADLFAEWRDILGEDRYIELMVKYSKRRLKDWTPETLDAEYDKLTIEFQELPDAPAQTEETE